MYLFLKIDCWSELKLERIWDVISSWNPEIRVYLFVDSELVDSVGFRVDPDEYDEWNDIKKGWMVQTWLRIIWWLVPFVSVLELPHILTLSGFIEERVLMVVVGRETGWHVRPVIFDVWSLVIVLWWQFLVSHRILLWIVIDLLPLMIRGGLAGFWKYLRVGLSFLRQCRNIILIIMNS